MCPMPSVAVAIAHIADGEFKLMLLMLFRWWWLLLGSSKDSHRIPRVCVCVCECPVPSFVSFSFHFFPFRPAASRFYCRTLQLPLSFYFTLFHFFILSNLHFSPGCGLFFWQGWFPLTYINTYMNVCRTCDGVSYAPDFDPFPGGWDLRRLATHPSAVTLGKVSCK